MSRIKETSANFALEMAMAKMPVDRITDTDYATPSVRFFKRFRSTRRIAVRNVITPIWMILDGIDLSGIDAVADDKDGLRFGKYKYAVGVTAMGGSPVNLYTQFDSLDRYSDPYRRLDKPVELNDLINPAQAFDPDQVVKEWENRLASAAANYGERMLHETAKRPVNREDGYYLTAESYPNSARKI